MEQVICNDVQNLQTQFDIEIDQDPGMTTLSLIAVPVLTPQREVVASLLALNKTSGVFRPGDVVAMELLARQAAVALQTAHKTEARIAAKQRDERLIKAGMQLSSPITRPGDPQGWLSLIGGRLAKEVLNAQSADCFMVVPPNGDAAPSLVTFVEEPQGLAEKTVPLKGVMSAVVQRCSTANIDPKNDTRFPANSPLTSMLCAPILDPHGHAVGLVNVRNKLGGGLFDAGDEKALASLCQSLFLAFAREQASAVSRGNSPAPLASDGAQPTSAVAEAEEIVSPVPVDSPRAKSTESKALVKLRKTPRDGRRDTVPGQAAVLQALLMTSPLPYQLSPPKPDLHELLRRLCAQYKSVLMCARASIFIVDRDLEIAWRRVPSPKGSGHWMQRAPLVPAPMLDDLVTHNSPTALPSLLPRKPKVQGETTISKELLEEAHALVVKHYGAPWSSIGRVALTGKPFIYNWMRKGGQPADMHCIEEMMEVDKMHSCLLVPIFDQHDDVRCVVQLVNHSAAKKHGTKDPPVEYTDKHLAIAQEIARMAAPLIAEAYLALRATKAELRASVMADASQQLKGLLPVPVDLPGRMAKIALTVDAESAIYLDLTRGDMQVRGLVGGILRNRAVHNIHDLSQSAALSAARLLPLAPHEAGHNAAVALPILTPQGDVLLGCLEVVGPCGPWPFFPPEDEAWLLSVCAIIGATHSTRMLQQQIELVQTQLEESKAKDTLMHKFAHTVHTERDPATMACEVNALGKGLLMCGACNLVLTHGKDQMAFFQKIGDAVDTVVKPRAGLLGAVLATGQAIVVTNAQTDRRFDQDVDQMGGFQAYSMICQPVRIHDYTVGVFQFINSHHGDFTPSEQEKTASFAAQVGSALQNFRHFERMSSTLKATMTLVHINLGISEAFFHLSKICRECVGCERVRVWMCDQEQQLLFTQDHQHAPGPPQEAPTPTSAKPVQTYRLPVGYGLAGWAAARRTVLHVRDVHCDRNDLPVGLEEYMHSDGDPERNCLCVPVMNSFDDVVAVLEVQDKHEGLSFDADDIQVLQSITAQCGEMIVNAMRFDRLLSVKTGCQRAIVATCHLLKNLADLSRRNLLVQIAAITGSLFGTGSVGAVLTDETGDETTWTRFSDGGESAVLPRQGPALDAVATGAVVNVRDLSQYMEAQCSSEAAADTPLEPDLASRRFNGDKEEVLPKRPHIATSLMSVPVFAFDGEVCVVLQVQRSRAQHPHPYRAEDEALLSDWATIVGSTARQWEEHQLVLLHRGSVTASEVAPINPVKINVATPAVTSNAEHVAALAAEVPDDVPTPLVPTPPDGSRPPAAHANPRVASIAAAHNPKAKLFRSLSNPKDFGGLRKRSTPKTATPPLPANTPGAHPGLAPNGVRTPRLAATNDVLTESSTQW